MASGEAAEPLQYTTTALRVSIHCEGCKKKVKKVLHSIEGVYKVTVDAAQHKVTVTGSVEAAALVRRLHKAGKQAAPWPSPSPAPPANVEANKAAPAALPAAPGEGGAKDKEAADTKPKDKAAEADAKEKKPAKDKGSGKNAGPGEAADAKPGKDVASSDAAGVIAGPKETEKSSSPEPVAAKPDAAEEPKDGGEGRKKGKKSKKNKPKDGGEGEAPAPAPAATPAAAPEKKAPQQPSAVPAPAPGPDRPHGGGGAFPCYAAQPVLSYNVAHPSSSVSYCAPTASVPMPPPPPPQMVLPYWYPPYPAMVPVPAEFVYGPPGMRSFPPQESYNNMFNEDNANSCSLM